MTVTLRLNDDEALVVFEWLTREVDERKGAGLSDVLVNEGEFWALNQLHGAVEREMLQSFAANYASAVRAARARLTPAPEDTHFAIKCSGQESSAMSD